MNLRDALIAGPEHGTDRLSVDADRRLRRRLGLETTRAAASRRVWVWPALGAFAAAAVIVVVLLHNRTNEPPRVAGFVDTSTQRWSGTVTADALVVDASSPAGATVSWRDASIVAAPGTQLTSRSDGGLVLAHGAIQIQRTDVKPQVVDVPMGRAVFASYRSSIEATRESVTIVLGDGTGHFTDAAGHTYPLAPAVPLVLPLPDVRTGSSTSSEPPLTPTPTPTKPARGRSQLAPGETPPRTESSGPPGATAPIVRPDTPCTFKSDCEPGATCRKNEHGASVCMGNGGEGAACWFDNDCVSNLCVTRRCAP